MGSKAIAEMAHPTIDKPVEPIQEYSMDNSNPPNETKAPVLDYKVYGMKVEKYMVKYKEFIVKEMA